MSGIGLSKYLFASSCTDTDSVLKPLDQLSYFQIMTFNQNIMSTGTFSLE